MEIFEDLIFNLFRTVILQKFADIIIAGPKQSTTYECDLHTIITPLLFQENKEVNTIINKNFWNGHKPIFRLWERFC